MKKPLDVLPGYPEHDDTLCGLVASRAQPNPQHPFLLFGKRT